MRPPSSCRRAIGALLGLCAALLAPRAEALTVAGFGDSMTWYPGYLAAFPAEWQTINLSQGGELSWNGRSRLETLLPTLHTDVVILMEGTNDVRDPTYTQQRSVDSLTAMVDAVLAADFGVVLMAPPPLKPSYPNGHLYDPLLASLADALEAVAAARGVPFVDLFALFQASSAMESFYQDDIHPSATGSAFIAAAAAAAVYQAIVPEPSTGLLVGAGIASFAWRKRARRR